MERNHIEIPYLIFLFFLFPFFLQAQKAFSPTLFDSIYSGEVSRVEVYLDIDTLLLNKLTDKEQDARVKIVMGDQLIDLPVDISVRSKSRRRYCDFPPIKFDFTKRDLEALGLDNEDEYKIVTHCLDSKDGEEVLMKEYLAYQLYQILTPFSLRAKRINIVYIDTVKGSRFEKQGLWLESEDEFAKKMNGKLCNCMGTPIDSIDAAKMEFVAMFQYMIGNTDMDHLVERNVKLIKPKEGGKMFPVAYDFDYSALVNAPYVHTKVLDNRSLKRVYLGFRENSSQLQEVIRLFVSKEDEILDFIKNFELISGKERRNCLQYVKDFFQEIKQEQLVLPYK